MAKPAQMRFPNKRPPHSPFVNLVSNKQCKDDKHYPHETAISKWKENRCGHPPLQNFLAWLLANEMPIGLRSVVLIQSAFYWQQSRDYITGVWRIVTLKWWNPASVVNFSDLDDLLTNFAYPWVISMFSVCHGKWNESHAGFDLQRKHINSVANKGATFPDGLLRVCLWCEKLY